MTTETPNAEELIQLIIGDVEEAIQELESDGRQRQFAPIEEAQIVLNRALGRLRTLQVMDVTIAPDKPKPR